MIEIIKHGKKKYHFVCDKCGCEFTSDGAEIFSEKRPGGKRWIYCPECGHEIIVDDYDPKVEEDLVKKDNEYVNDWLEESKKLFEKEWTKDPFKWETNIYDYYDCSKCPNRPAPGIYEPGDTPCNWCPKMTIKCDSFVDNNYKYEFNLAAVSLDYYIDTSSTYTALTSECYKGK